ncbi:IDEAL domain-containing protein [Halalkalibacter krulwichiae]|uniref:IDEAL domain protein n=1 Tax=Halalkalibacter krulwichiae TaxID=199441 RepID=A0A1X9MFW5_9BACI|nr:IDEAL domain-containing protein [Halalkalibacter krulwichiae]ARK31534.1 IDEAL domain protein [Halalkalibacter krulwichiae]
MLNDFAMDPNVTRQLKVIRSLESRSEDTVKSLYAQAVLEYSFYYYKKKQLYDRIDHALVTKDEQLFTEATAEYIQLIESHQEGKTVSENGFELYLNFD